MDTKFKNILDNIQQLNHSDRELLKKYLNDIDDSEKIIDLI